MDRDEKIKSVLDAIGQIPASNPGVITFHQSTLRSIISDSLLRQIAEVAVDAIRSGE